MHSSKLIILIFCQFDVTRTAVDRGVLRVRGAFRLSNGLLILAGYVRSEFTAYFEASGARYVCNDEQNGYVLVSWLVTVHFKVMQQQGPAEAWCT